MDEQLEIYSYLDNLFEDKFNQTYTMQPATIQKYNDDNTVNMRLDNENFLLEDIPLSIFGDKNSYITTPTMHEGVKGLLLFSKHDLFSWLSDGKDEDAKTTFSKNNGFFLLGATWKNNRIKYNHEAIEIKTNKAIETYSQNDTTFDSNKNINLAAVIDILMNAENISQTAKKDIKQTAKEKLIQDAKNITGIAQTSINYQAPSISVSNTSTGEELFNLLGQALDTVQKMAHELTLAKDTADNSPLTNSARFEDLKQEASELSEKFKGFNNE